MLLLYAPHIKYNANVRQIFSRCLLSCQSSRVSKSGENRPNSLKHRDSLKGMCYPPVLFVRVPCCSGNLVFTFKLENKAIYVHIYLYTVFEYQCILLTVACLYSHIITRSSSSTRFKFTPSTQAPNTHALSEPFPICCTLAHTKCDDLDKRGKHNCTFALHQVCVLIPSANSSSSDGKDHVST